MEGVLGKHILGGASAHIKALDSTLIPQQRNSCTEGIWGQYPLSMLGRTLKRKEKVINLAYSNHLTNFVPSSTSRLSDAAMPSKKRKELPQFLRFLPGWNKESINHDFV